MHHVVGLEMEQRRETENSSALSSTGTIEGPAPSAVVGRSVVWLSRVKEGKLSASEKLGLLITLLHQTSPKFSPSI